MPTMQETQVQSLGQEDPLEKEMATHSSILAWKIPWMEEPGRLQSMGSQRVGHNRVTSLTSLLMPLLNPVITILMVLVIAPCVTHFVSAHVDKLQHVVPV